MRRQRCPLWTAWLGAATQRESVHSYTAHRSQRICKCMHTQTSHKPCGVPQIPRAPLQMPNFKCVLPHYCEPQSGEVGMSRAGVPFPSSRINNNQQTPWPLVRKRTIPTERPPFVDEIVCQLLWIEGCCVVSAADPLWSLISVF
jgi:hypothetical protein